MTRALGTGTAFLFGFGFALLPAVGPFLAVLLFISSRFHTHRGDLLWTGVALLYALPAATGGDLGLATGSALQIGAGWLIYRAFEQIARHHTPSQHATTVDVGLLLGLAVVTGLNLLQIEAWNFATAKTIAQAIVWETSPALFGHTILVLGGLIAIVARSRFIRFGALGLSAFGILVSGSREAAIGWLVLAVVGSIYGRSASWRTRVAELIVIAAMVAVGTGVGPTLGWGKVGFLLQPSSQGGNVNLLQGTEVPYGDWWDTSWVSVAAHDVTLSGTPMTEYVVTKNGSETWLRLQQAVQIEPGGVYTVSAWLHDGETEARPGIQGWGRAARPDDGSAFVLSGARTAEGWSAFVRGPGSLVASGVAQHQGAWQRVYATFEYTGVEPIAWFVGLVPDARLQAATTSRFAGFQLERGELSGYEPGVATRGLGLAVARTPYWRAAWEGFLERPITGWGDGAYPEWFLRGELERSRMQVVPAHPHNFFLHVAFERGIIGLAAVALLLAALTVPAARRRDGPLLALLCAVVLANLFDATLLYGGVFYPLVAIAGWRIGTAEARAHAPSRVARRLGVRLGLAITDTAAAAGAYYAAIYLSALAGPWLGFASSSQTHSAAVAYAWLLWPLLSWREGLYPGYGLTPQQELKKQSTVALHAGLFLLAVVVLLPAYAPIPIHVVVLTAALSFVTLPISRSIIKRVLHATRVWGRPVVVLGAGHTGTRIVRSLLRSPLEGLHPVAIFDDDPNHLGRKHHGIPVVGALRDADRYAAQNGVGHAIVAIPSLGASRLRELLDTRGRHLRVVQYVPSLPGLPAEHVSASSLDGMLAIEVRNNLASASNRLAKRAIDLIGGSLGLVLLSPLLVAIGLWIRMDTRGPILYRSSRVGQGGEIFQCFKFRTMSVDADAQLERLLREDTALREEYERFHKLENDPRITRAGRILRQLSLDELPQLLNVVVGDMSLVGPRPYLTSELHILADETDIILLAKPGMTGYWQVSERNEVSFRERVEMEAHYVRNWSIWWDIVILARTLPAVLEKRGK